MLYDQRPVRVTLPDLHAWILEAREVLYAGPNEGMIMPDNLVLVGEPTDSSADVENVQEAFNLNEDSFRTLWKHSEPSRNEMVARKGCNRFVAS